MIISVDFLDMAYDESVSGTICLITEIMVLYSYKNWKVSRDVCEDWQ
jgi:hypothetical protein